MSPHTEKTSLSVCRQAVCGLAAAIVLLLAQAPAIAALSDATPVVSLQVPRRVVLTISFGTRGLQLSRSDGGAGDLAETCWQRSVAAAVKLAVGPIGLYACCCGEQQQFD